METTQMSQSAQREKPLRGKRILVCGKGGSGKSTLVALMTAVLQRKEYEVMVLDGDASNPEGLVRLLFGLGVQGEPKPLIEFFGGLDTVTCPVDDPTPLKRIGDSVPILGVLDCTHESVSIARRMTKFSEEMGMKDFWFVLNKTESGEMASMMLALLGDLSSKVIGSIPYDPGLVRAGLSGSPVGELKAIENVEPVVQRLEQSVSLPDSAVNGSYQP